MMTSTDSIRFIVSMIIMMNPLGSLSIFLDLTKKSASSLQKNIALRTCLAIIIIMIVTIWIGKIILDFFGITIPSFRFAGGIIILLMGFSMLQSRESPVSYTPEDDEAAKERHSISVVPMALPVIIGPGSISTLIIATGDYPVFTSKAWMSLLCIFLGVSVGIMLYYATRIVDVVGESVIKVITRIMGMIIMAIAVGMLADALTGLFPILH